MIRQLKLASIQWSLVRLDWYRPKVILSMEIIILRWKDPRSRGAEAEEIQMCRCSHSFMLSIDPLHRQEACQESGLTRSGWGRRHALRNLLAEQSRISWLSVSSQSVSMSVGAVIDIISGFLPIPISCSSPRSIPLLSATAAARLAALIRKFVEMIEK